MTMKFFNLILFFVLSFGLTACYRASLSGDHLRDSSLSSVRYLNPDGVYAEEASADEKVMKVQDVQAQEDESTALAEITTLAQAEDYELRRVEDPRQQNEKPPFVTDLQERVRSHAKGVKRPSTELSSLDLIGDKVLIEDKVLLARWDDRGSADFPRNIQGDRNVRDNNNPPSSLENQETLESLLTSEDSSLEEQPSAESEK